LTAVMIRSVKFQKKRLLLFPLKRHTTWTIYFTLYNNQFSPKSHHVSRKHTIYRTLVYWEQKIHYLHNHTHLIMMYMKTTFVKWGLCFQWQEVSVTHFKFSVAATLLFHTRVHKWDVPVDRLIPEVWVWHPHHGRPTVELPHYMALPQLPNCTPLPMILLQGKVGQAFSVYLKAI
jgi:hypothetical protein